MKNGVLIAVFTIVFTVAFSQISLAQYTVQHQQPTVLDRTVSNTLEFFVSGVNGNEIIDARLFYRNEGDLGYSQKEVFFRNGVFITEIRPEELTGTNFEYYFQLSVRNSDQDIFYPENLPSENPIQVDIVEGISETQRKKAEGIDYTILSPKPEIGLAKNDVFVAIALYYDIEEIEDGEFLLFIDDEDVTGLADTSAYFISYVPKGLNQGSHTVRLDYKTSSEQLEVVEWSFRVVDPKRAAFQSFEPRLFPTGRVELTARNQTISGDLNNAYTGRTYIDGSYGLFRYSINGFLTSQESDRLQPLNRFGVNLSLGKWWRFQAGHVYPTLSKFTISGRRMYGINTSAQLFWDVLNVQFLYGELSREVTNLYSSVSVDTVYANGIPQDTTYTLGYEESGRGTFARKIIGARVGLGNPRHFQFGIQAMKVEDDTTSIFNVIDANDLFGGPTTLFNNLNTADRNVLNQQPELLRVDGGSPRPKGNFVAGADLRFGLANNKIRFSTETVASVLNNDIYGGVLDSLRAADLGFEDIDQGDLDILDQISRFIIINENVSVLPIRFTNFNTDSSDTEVFFPTSILGSNSELSVNYPSNTFNVQYRWVGPEFVSLANSTIRKDIKGFTFSDRFRLLRNQVYVTLGYETLSDNVSNTKEATTNTISYRSNISWYPTKIKLPRVSAGFRYRTRENGVVRFNPLVPVGLENVAVQNIRIVDGDTLATTVPRMNNTLNLNFSITQQVPLLDMVHDATLSISSLNTKDEVFTFGDIKNTAVSFNVASRFELLPLRTQFGMTVNKTESGNGQLDIDIFGMYAGGSYYLLDGSVIVNGRIAFTSNTSKSRTLEIQNSDDDDFLNDYYTLSTNTTTSDFGTYVLLASAEYKLDNNHSFLFDSNFTNVSGANSFNDRVVQLRYIFRF